MAPLAGWTSRLLAQLTVPLLEIRFVHQHVQSATHFISLEHKITISESRLVRHVLHIDIVIVTIFNLICNILRM